MNSEFFSSLQACLLAQGSLPEGKRTQEQKNLACSLAKRIATLQAIVKRDNPALRPLEFSKHWVALCASLTGAN